MTINKLIIVAYNIRRGGGAILLLELLRSVKFLKNFQIEVLVSSELNISFSLPKNVNIKIIKPNLLGRLAAEYYLRLNRHPEDTLLFFGNLPPLFKLSGKIIVYVHNRFIVDELTETKVASYLLDKIRHFLQKKWLLVRANNVDVFLVQSPSMKMLLKSTLKASFPIIQLPFARQIQNVNRVIKKTKSAKVNLEFIYVASGEAHKNHLKLLLAWEALASEGIKHILHLTLNRKNNAALLSKVNEIKLSRKALIENHSDYSHDELIKLLRRSDALIYPSLNESLGLPLIEAKQLGIPIIASELDYVRDVIDPEFTFNPESEISIARAVKRFIGLKTEKIVIKSPTDLLNYLITNEKKVLK